MSKSLRTALEWIGALVLCVAALEGALRVQQSLGPLYDLEPRNSFLGWLSDVVNHRPPAHMAGRFVGKEMYGRYDGYAYDIAYDDNGIRQPVSKGSRPDCRKTASILFMGDSFIQGYDVENTVPDRVARVLADKYGVCSTAYNAGYASYSSAILVPLARQLLPVLSPDYIVVDIDETDMADDVMRYEALITRNEAGENVGVRATPLNVDISNRLDKAASHTLYIQRLFEKLYIRQVLMPRIAANQPDVFKYSRDRDAGLETKYRAELAIFRRNLVELISVLSKSVPPERIVFVRHPHLQQLAPQGGTPAWNDLVASTVARVAAQHGVVYFDAAPELARRFGDRPEAYYWKNDIHFTLEGLGLFADSVADFLGGLIPPG